jgi:ribosome-associated protein
MEDTLPETRQSNGFAATAEALAELLREHKGGDALVIDLRDMNAWTDFFIIATAASNTHLDGLERHVKEFCRERDIEILRRSRKPQGEDDEWRIIDLGPAVVHLMSSNARSFYELERLYSMALAGPATHSSNSSKSPSSS